MLSNGVEAHFITKYCPDIIDITKNYIYPSLDNP